MAEMQRIQNKASRQAVKNTEYENETLEELHRVFKLDALNVRFHKRANKTWDKISVNEEELYNQSIQEDRNDLYQDHYWWKRISPYVNQEEPEPTY